ncbi:MAG: Transcription factor iws1 [Geoglossum simile]|nr:MAG: Transcription factor iws1 [Geoglossum simile]
MSSRTASPLSDAGHGPDPPNRPPSTNLDMDMSDNDSELSDLDEAIFEDFDDRAVAVDRPIAVDESNVALLGVHKRKRPEGEKEADEASKKKKRETRREKPKKLRKPKDVEDDVDFLEDGDGSEKKKRRVVGERKQRARARVRTPSPEKDEDLTPEERRKKALDRAMDEALKNPNKRRRKKDEVDLERAADEEIEHVKRRMVDAAQNDGKAREAGKPAMYKLKMLPEVVALLNRNTIQHTILDPELNFLEAVKFFLEPLSDGSLPAYNIQSELFAALAKLPINTESLLASGIGKVALFYTKSKRPEPGIKRQAERLMGEWSRPILKRSDDYRQRKFVETEYDPTNLPLRTSRPAASQAAADREAALAPPVRNPNRARMQTSGPKSYDIVPKSVISGQNTFARPGADEAFRRMKARELAKDGRMRR